MVASGLYGSVMAFKQHSFPFMAFPAYAHHTDPVQGVPGLPLPYGLQKGDVVDLSATDWEGRISYMSGYTANLPLGRSHDFVVIRDGIERTIRLTTVDLGNSTGFKWVELETVFIDGLSTVFAMLLL